PAGGTRVHSDFFYSAASAASSAGAAASAAATLADGGNVSDKASLAGRFAAMAANARSRSDLEPFVRSLSADFLRLKMAAAKEGRNDQSPVGPRFFDIVALPAVNVLLQTVYIPGAKTTEGELIDAVAPPWFEIIRLLTADPSLAFRIDARSWEKIIAAAYRQA